MTKSSKKALLALTLSISAIAGCSKAPAPTAPVQPAQPAVTPGGADVVKNISDVQPAGGGAAILENPCPAPAPGVVPIVPWNADCRFIAFTACEPDKRGGDRGSMFLYDDAIKDVYILNGALAGLNSSVTNPVNASQKSVEGMGSCSELEQLNPKSFADGKVLFSFGHGVYIYDMVAEERVTVAFDGAEESGNDGTGPRASITADGHLLAYISNKGTVVLKETDGAFYTKTRELTKIAAEANFQHNNDNGGAVLDIDLSGDGRWMVINIDGILYLYDVANPHLFQILPLSGSALAGYPDGVGHVAISFDGRFVAFTVGCDDFVHNRDHRLLVLDRQTGFIDTVPYANLGDTISGSNFGTIILDPMFCYDGRSLLFETAVGSKKRRNGDHERWYYANKRDFRVWKYDMLNETLRGLVILNNALGEKDTQVLISDPVLN